MESHGTLFCLFFAHTLLILLISGPHHGQRGGRETI